GPALLLDFSNHLSQFLQPSSRHRHACPFPRKRKRDCSTDARTAAGNQRHLARESCHGIPFPRVLWDAAAPHCCVGGRDSSIRLPLPASRRNLNLLYRSGSHKRDGDSKAHLCASASRVIPLTAAPASSPPSLAWSSPRVATTFISSAMPRPSA